MKTTELIDLLTKYHYFESSCYKTPEFLSFAKDFKRIFKKTFSGDNVTFNVGHFYLSGFIERRDKCVYFSIGDVRPHWDGKIMYRTAKNTKDYTGGANYYTNVYCYDGDINYMLDKMFDGIA